MAKCTRCGRKGFFLKLTNGLCDNCVSTMRMEQEQAALKAQMEEISAKLSDQKALFERISADAYADGVAKAKAKNAELTTQNLQIEERILAGKKNLVELSEKYQVELPISKAVYDILYDNADPRMTLHQLFTRSLKNEF
mgnify:CR=1 FL=1